MDTRLLLATASTLLTLAAHAQQPPPPPPAVGPGGMPAGPYQAHCADIRAANGVLSARCAPTPLVPSSIPLPCAGVVEVMNGKLGCRLNPPPGSYQKSCRNIFVKGTNLVADCARRDQSFNQGTTLPLPCAGAIENIDGTLRCTTSPTSGSPDTSKPSPKPPGPTTAGPTTGGPTTGAPPGGPTTGKPGTTPTTAGPRPQSPTGGPGGPTGPSPGTISINLIGSPNGSLLVSSDGKPWANCPAGVVSCGIGVKSPAQVTAVPKAGYEFSGWTGLCANQPKPVCDVSVSGDVGATYKAKK